VHERTRYDRCVSIEPPQPAAEPPADEAQRRRRRLLRLVVTPLVLLVGFWAVAFTLAKLHLAKPGAPKAAAGAAVPLGDPYRGEVTFDQTCASCHGKGGKGGGIGPRLQEDQISIAAVKAQIDNGGGAMPPKLVTGAVESDVLAYVATLIAPTKP
jgi:mono/diheme cytochrome c family protein